MSDILRKHLAPVPDDAWTLIEEEARRSLQGSMSARSLADVDGPHGWDFAAVNLGRVTPSTPRDSGIEWTSRTVLPLVEYRLPFSIAMTELDAIARGADDADLNSVHLAARKVAVFEETAVYLGLEKAGIKGLLQAASRDPVKLADNGAGLYEGVAEAVLKLEQAGTGGPYALVLGTAGFNLLRGGDVQGYPLRKRIEELITSGIRWSPVVKGGVVASKRGGDFVLTLGQDVSIGYLSHNAEQVDLYFTGSFTFRCVDPDAAIELTV